MKPRWIWLAPLFVLLSACGTLPSGGGYFEDDGPEARPPADVANVPDAVPKDEPRSTTGNNPYAVYGVTYSPMTDARGYRERGVASWYGKKFHSKRTSSGEPYDMYAMTAAHKTLPLPSYARVRNLQNGRSVVVRVNDRGPFLHNRLIDLSYAAAARLGILGTGTGVVEVEAVGPDEPATQVAQVKTYPLQVISTAAAAEELSPSPLKPEAIPPPSPAKVEALSPPTARTTSSATLPAGVEAARHVPAQAGTPKLYLQVGAFTQWDNAVILRNRLEREALRPISIQPPQEAKGGGADTARIYRVRVGPLTNVEEGDRLTQRASQLGVPDARIVVE